MQITLMRHGKPQLPENGWVTPRGMKQWIENYNNSDVETDSIPHECFNAAVSAKLIATSTLKRAESSSKALGRKVLMSDSVFSEAELPHALWSAPYLPPKAWAVFFRLLWLCGYSRGVASHKTTRIRAKAAAHQLILAANDGPVLLVGHGVMNRYIGKELRTLGWTAVCRHDNCHWGIGVYRITSADSGGVATDPLT